MGYNKISFPKRSRKWCCA